MHAAAQVVMEGKTMVWTSSLSLGGHRGGLLVDLEEILANHLVPRED